MKRLLMVLGLLAAASAFGSDDVTVKLGNISVVGTHTNFWFEPTVIIHNSTLKPLTAANLFLRPSGLALRISDLDGKELKRVYRAPYMIEPRWIIRSGDNTFTNISYGFEAWNGGHPSISLPDGVHTVRVQVDGTLSGSSYTNRLTSNIVEVQVP